MRKFSVILVLVFWCSKINFGQTVVTIYLDSISINNSGSYKPGVFFVPKTTTAQNDFLSNNIEQNAIRVNVIESALNNSTNLNDCIVYLDGMAPVLQQLSSKTEKLIFIFEKMPAWLSSSSDASPAATPGWAVLNTKPPASWTNWNTTVSAIADRIFNTHGITNAYFEIWNEPDLGSWTGTEKDYFLLFKNTYSAIKSVDNSIPVGGPATNFWANGLFFQPSYGYVSASNADSSFIGKLIDSSLVWNMPLDFISWHNFNLTWQSHQNAVEYIAGKYATYGITMPQLIVSEWNTNSAFRDLPVQKSFFIKNLIELGQLPVSNNVVAAWQDFNSSSAEFHQDYGLLTFGGIHKPVYHAILLATAISDTLLKTQSSAPLDIVTSTAGDTLQILITNYAPPPFIEALNHTLFSGQLTINQLDSAGYVDVNQNNINRLDSIYRGLLTIPGNTAINTAINEAIPVYSHYDSIQNTLRHIILQVNNISGTYQGKVFIIDSTTNNWQYRYDSLLAQGFNQNNAISYILSNQQMVSQPVVLNNSQISFLMQPNSVLLFQFTIPQLSSSICKRNQTLVIVYPNPAKNNITVVGKKPLGEIWLLDTSGKLVKKLWTNKAIEKINLEDCSPGIYWLHIPETQQSIKIIRE